MVSVIRGDDNFDSAGPFSHWTSLSEVTLGGSAVSAIDITLPSGYDAYKIQFNIPTPTATSGSAQIRFLNGGTTQNFSYTGFYTLSGGDRNQTETTTTLTLGPNVGGALPGSIPTYFAGTIEIFDAQDSGIKTSFIGQQGAGTQQFSEAMALLNSGYQNTAATTSQIRFQFDGQNMRTGSGFYYRLYGHAYS